MNRIIMGMCLLLCTSCKPVPETVLKQYSIGNSKLAHAYVNEGKNVNIYLIDEENSPNTLLMLAIRKGDRGLIDAILSRSDWDINLEKSFDMNSLHYAVVHDDTKTLKILLSRFDDINIGYKGMTPLIYAVLKNSAESLNLVLNHPSVQIDMPIGSSGRTALHLAVLRGYPEVVNILLQHGINKELKNEDGKTALELTFEMIAETNQEIKDTQKDQKRLHMLQELLGKYQQIVVLLDKK